MKVMKHPRAIPGRTCPSPPVAAARTIIFEAWNNLQRKIHFESFPMHQETSKTLTVCPSYDQAKVSTWHGSAGGRDLRNAFAG
jgi:hypothetical protein